ISGRASGHRRDLRAGRGGHPVPHRGRGDRDRQRHDLRPCGLGVDPRRREGAAHGARHRGPQPLGELEHRGPGRDAVRRLQAVRLRARARAPRDRRVHRGQDHLLQHGGM
ncbi:MAG: Aldehyde dehydrogenase, partial [uncultured Solirubrobacteraceae bacterium]